ncbi:MAG TPA: DegT/DnrJ/EryC1/StrS family aminotransferase [Acetobacteraceae bacterium]|nr:DegT/DnrJ/EryC1/StrS family aminotransferase [Acetobacteraceae bacterium]
MPSLIPVARPRLPSAGAIVPYLRQIDANAWYSNHGPLAQEFQTRLASHFGLAAPELALVANATSGLTLALLASGARPGSHCLMPSWTFVASAAAVAAAGLTPHFVDVCPGTWAPDPAEIRHLAARHDIGAILVVSPFGAPIDLASWDAVKDATGLPVVIDGAAAFDTLRADGPMPVGACPVAISLHATKVFGIGEGGAVLCRDAAFTQRVRRLAQFGFAGTREAQLRGVNAKISEYAAAVGLAGLDTWPETRARWDGIMRSYVTMLPEEVALAPSFGLDWVSSTLTVLWPSDRPSLAEELADRGIATLSWWGPGCHAQPAYRDCPAQALPVTDIYARRAVGLPFWQDLSEGQIASVCSSVRRLAAKPRPKPARPVLVQA